MEEEKLMQNNKIAITPLFVSQFMDFIPLYLTTSPKIHFQCFFLFFLWKTTKKARILNDTTFSSFLESGKMIMFFIAMI